MFAHMPSYWFRVSGRIAIMRGGIARRCGGGGLVVIVGRWVRG